MKLMIKWSMPVLLVSILVGCGVGEYAQHLSEEQKYVSELKRYAAENDLEAQHLLGNYYWKQNDLKQAIYWYERSAKNGEPNSAYNLAMMYMNGEGVPMHYPTAAHYYEMAAIKGHPVALHNLGLMHINGEGMPVNREKAVYLFGLACQQGLNESCQAYQELR